MQIYNKKILTNVVLDSNQASEALQLYHIFGYAVQIVVTGTPTGTFKLQASCDDINSITPPVNWIDVLNSNYTMSAAGSYIWNVTDVMYNWVRLVYTDASSGTSTAVVNAIINTKGV